MKKCTLAFKVFTGIACFLGFLTISSEFARSQSEKPEIRTEWNPEKQILLATPVAVPSRTLPFEITEQEITPPIPKVMEPALLDHTELQAMAGYLYYEILPGRGVRFKYSEVLYDHMGHEWFLEMPRDLRGKTVRIDYLGYVPREMTFRIAKSGTSAAVEKKVALQDSLYGPRSVFIDIPNTIPFKEVKYLEFWFDRKSAGRSHGDFMIEKVVVVENTEKGKGVVDESRPEPFPFDRPFAPTNLMWAEA